MVFNAVFPFFLTEEKFDTKGVWASLAAIRKSSEWLHTSIQNTTTKERHGQDGHCGICWK